jgi:putative heme-binding domain-containing protein
LDRPLASSVLESSGEIRNQAEWFHQLKLFIGKEDDDDLPRRRGTMVNPYDALAELDLRARSYLGINCAHCHRRDGGGTARIEFPFGMPPRRMNALDESPTQGTFGISQAKIISKGRPYQSTLYYRLATVGRGHMPQLGTRNVDEAGLKLIRDWIVSLSSNPDGAPRAEIPLDDQSLLSLPDDVRSRLLADTSAALQLADRVGEIRDQDQRELLSASLAEHSPAHLRGLFERFLPPEKRRETLGTNVDVAAILAMNGDVEAGRTLFATSEGVSCRNCHKAEGVGQDVGPDLTWIASQRSREQILESILEPSRQIEQKFATYAVETKQGQVFSGILKEQTDRQVVLRDTGGKETVIEANEVVEMLAQPRSLMPELLVKELTARDLADLLAYLSSLK